MMEWHSTSIKKLFSQLNTGKQGLTNEEAAKRLEKYGLNEIEREKKISPWKIFFSQFKSMLVIILIAAVAVSIFLGKRLDAAVIGVVLVLNAVFGFVQEYKAERAIEALKKMAALKATVVRSGEKQVILAKELVPGDIMILDEGDKISADARLLESYSLETQEAALTGESLPVSKSVGTFKEKTSLAERHNMAYSGTIATRGRAIALVTATGKQTELGKVAKMLEHVEKEIPLKKQLDSMGRWIGIAVILLCLAVFLVQVLRGGEIISVFIISLALAVAAIPEGLPAVVTIALALGVQRMAKGNALVRQLPSVETLGSTNVICTDKTGTLTMNQMTVKQIYANGEFVDISGEGYKPEGKFSADTKNIMDLLKIGTLCNDAAIADSNVIGDPTEGALLVSAMKAGLKKDKLEKQFRRVDEIPFTSERKMMTTIHKTGRKKFAFMKGAPRSVLNRCTKFYYNGKIRKLTQKERDKIIAADHEMANQALRVLAFAYKECISKDDAEKEMIFAGLQGMIDPPRHEAKEAINKCKKAGIKVVMITGDQRLTAEAVAKQLGLEGRTVTGKDLDEMKDSEFHKIADEVAVYARVNPQHKIKIIDALKKKGYTVAMTGDGVNDAPALKEAHIGVAMGIAGTDVAKEASDMVLLDDNFASIVNAVEEGRGIYDNIRKFVAYLLSCNLAEVLIVFIAVLLSLPLPFIAIQILWINLVTDSFPALALGVDPRSTDVMMKRPRKPKEHIISRGLALGISLIAIATTAITLYLFNHYLPETRLAQTVAFTTLVTIELTVPFIIRARYRAKLFSNPWLLSAIVLSLMLQLAVIYSPLSKLFNTLPLKIEWLYIASATLALFAVGFAVERGYRWLTEGKINKS